MAVAVCAVGAVESVALTVKALMPVVVGVPEILPVAAFSVKPAGSVPVVMVHVTGFVPPLDCKVWL